MRSVIDHHPPILLRGTIVLFAAGVWSDVVVDSVACCQLFVGKPTCSNFTKTQAASQFV